MREFCSPNQSSPRRKQLAAALILGAIISTGWCADLCAQPITANVIHRVFRLTNGTCFAIDVEGRQYIVTAKHVATNLHITAGVQIYSKGAWERMSMKLIGHSSQADISVLAAVRKLTPPTDLPMPSKDSMAYSQDVFFLGFPYGMTSPFAFEAGGGGYPLPFAKKAIVSCLATQGLYFLDGHNNPGFSGGPVVYTPVGGQGFQVAAVISGYRYDDEPVLAGGQKTPLVYRANTGIIVAWSIEHALTVIRTNQIGFKL